MTMLEICNLAMRYNGIPSGSRRPRAPGDEIVKFELA
jgi:hypothetical protein